MKTNNLNLMDFDPNNPILSLDFLYKALFSYVTERFGSYSKNDFEVLVFNSLLQGSFNDKSDSEIGRFLHIPESKVRKLREEADYRYNRGESETKNDNLDKLHELFDNARIKGEKVQIVIEDPDLIKLLEEILKDNGKLDKVNMRTEIISMPKSVYEFLMDSLFKS